MNEYTTACEEFLNTVADEEPIKAFVDYNACKFCDKSWAENTYEEYIENSAKLKEDPDVRNPQSHSYIKWEHHDSDCIWVEANRIRVELGAYDAI